MIIPAGHRVLVKPDELEEKSKGGIVIIHKERDRNAQVTGTLIAVGRSAWKSWDDGSPWAQPGDRVYFAQYAGGAVKDGDDDYRLMNDEDITAVIRDDVQLRAIA